MIGRFVTAAALALSAPGMAATLIGHTANVDYRYFDLDSSYAQATATPPTFTIGTGAESTVDVEGVTWLSVDFGAQSLTVTFTTVLTNPTWNPVPFNGLRFDGNAIDRIVSVSVDPSTTLPGFTAARIVHGAGVLGLNWNGITYADGQQVTLNFGVVPEPTVWLQMLAGFALIGFVLRSPAKVARAPA